MAVEGSHIPEALSFFGFRIDNVFTFINSLPPALLLGFAPKLIAHYRTEPQYARSGILLRLKIFVTKCLVGIDFVTCYPWNLLLGNISHVSSASCLLSICVSISLSLLIRLEHKHTLRSSASIGSWLVLAIICDANKALLYHLYKYPAANLYIATTSTVLKLILLILDEFPKKDLFIDEEVDDEAAEEVSCGFVSRTALWICQCTIGSNKLNELRADDSVEVLTRKFHVRWRAANKAPPNSLAHTLFYTLLPQFTVVIILRICFSVALFAQPLLLHYVMDFVENPNPTSQQKALAMFASLLTYGGITISHGAYLFFGQRLIALLRGAVLSAIFTKTLALPHSKDLPCNVKALISTELEDFLVGIPEFHDVWACLIDIHIGMYLLVQEIGPMAFLVAVSALFSSLASHFLAMYMPAAKRTWTTVVQSRVDKMSYMLSNLKVLRISGLDTVLSKQIRNLFGAEIASGAKFRNWTIRLVTASVMFDSGTAPAVFAGAIFWVQSANMTIRQVYMTLAVIQLLSTPLGSLLAKIPAIVSMFASLTRIQDFLNLPEVQDNRQNRLNVRDYEPTNNDRSEYMVEFKETSLAIQGNDTITLQNINISVRRQQLIMVVGPKGCGKSMMLSAIIGETRVVRGLLFVESQRYAYCGQIALIQDNSIRYNIVGEAAFDEKWYDRVLEACCFRKELLVLPLQDFTPAGSNGVNLNMDQKQKIALARALYRRPELLVLDDILSAMDYITAGRIRKNLFGPGGLLKSELPTTVIMATHSSQYLDNADAVLLFDSNGTIKVHTDISNNPKARQELRDIADIDHIVRNREIRQHAGALPLNQMVFLQPQMAEYARDRGQDNQQVYLFYIRTFNWHLLLVWLVCILLVTFIEKYTGVAASIWLEKGYDNRPYFIGFALFCLSATFFTVADLSIFFLRLIPASAAYIHRLFMDTVARAAFHYISSNDAASIFRQCIEDISATSQTLPLAFIRAVFSTATIVVNISAMTSGVGLGPFLLFVFGGLIYSIQSFYSHHLQKASHFDKLSRTQMHHQITEIAAGLQHVRALNRQVPTLGAGFAAIEESQISFYSFLNVQRWLNMMIDCSVLFAAFLITGMVIAFHQTVSVVGVAISFVGLGAFSTSLTNTAKDWTSLRTSMTALSRLCNFIEETPREQTPNQLQVQLPPLWPQSGSIEIKNIAARYSPGSQSPRVLSDISLRIPARYKIGISGPTGSGKSSLLMALLNLLTVDSGSVNIDGMDVSKISQTELRQRLNIICQDFVDFEGSVRECLFPWSIHLGEDKEDERAPNSDNLKEVLKKVHLYDLVMSNGGLDANVATLHLSNGQRRLMMIARAILHRQFMDSKVVLLDEATSGLDSDMEERVLSVMEDAFFDCTVLIAAHSTVALRSAHLILHMEDGKIVDETYVRSFSDTDAQSPNNTADIPRSVSPRRIGRLLLDRSLRELRKKNQARTT